jgi:hypothetical protein
MTVIVARLLALGLLILQAAIAVGLIVALVRIALGHREGFVQLGGVLLAVLVLVMWETGTLAVLVEWLTGQLASGPGAPSLGLGGNR